MIPRNLALSTLNSPDNTPGFSERYLERAFRHNPGMSERDRAFTVNLVQGVIRWRLRLDWIIGQAVRFPFRKIEPAVLNTLRIAVYQIFFLDRVPESAAVSEAVKQAKTTGRPHLARFVNGILRHICRQKDRIAFPDPGSDRIRYMSVSYSYPTWLIEMWAREMGIESVEPLLDAGNRIPALVIRVNTLKIDRPGLIKRLKGEGVAGRPTQYSPEGIEIEGLKGPVNELNAFKEGLFQVQGEAAQVCAHLLFPKAGESVLDICAGLGGKSTHVAQLTKGMARILALDIAHSRLVRLLQSSRRLGIKCIQPIVADAGAKFSSKFRCQFDKIIIDAPCSALGTISRHPDAKWTRHKSDLKRLSLLQRKILNQAVPLLRKGGKMLYVTCTISTEENEDVVSDFLEKNKEMALENLKNHVPEGGLDLINNQGFFKAFPDIHGMDGFFGALFTKKYV